MFQNHFEQLRGEKKKRNSPSPVVTSVVSSRTSNNKQAFLSSAVKKKVKKQKALGNQATLTDTESTKMHDLLKKGYFNSKNKRAPITGRIKSKSTSGNNQFKNKLKLMHGKALSNSRSPQRTHSQSTESNKKIKSTMASTEIKRSHELRNSGQSVSIASEKPKAAYFKNTLESHKKIGAATLKGCKSICLYFSLFRR